MTVLVADVGGTNTRIGLADGGAVTRISRYENDVYPSFDAVLTEYVSQLEDVSFSGAVIAVAGPVTSDRASLTNRNWRFDSGRLAALLPGTGKVHLLNDLAALGHALPDLAEQQIATLLAGSGQQINTQQLVVGVGTGFNVCLLRDGVVMAAELGHASLPSNVQAVLVASLGRRAEMFPTNEAILSGRGLSRLHKAMTDTDMDGPSIISATGVNGCDVATETVSLFARVLGCFTRELVFQYLPMGGIYFAGGAARGLLGSNARHDFAAAFLQEGAFYEQMAQIPVHMISDDQAALTGAARYLGGR
ncbi:Glucokinase [Falsiruegeria litorea R37]|uniref:Glucokinase n=1 Tax=Falsiruegeria litorea R37 TaxID=1200284 RepID=A0A1Y5T256_9RHOB|nr:ROK family protein [Falsiruegeria litorea]SLN53712.1 Glucokinase [Falsiruegeria litorea R37]